MMREIYFKLNFEKDKLYDVLAKKICYSGYKKLETYLKTLCVTPDVWEDFLSYMKNNHPEQYDTIMMNMNTLDTLDDDKHYDMVLQIREKIISNPRYCSIDYLRDTNGLAPKKFMDIYRKRSNPKIDEYFAEVAKRLSFVVNEYEGVDLKGEYVFKDPLTHELIPSKHITLEEREALVKYIKLHGWPLNNCTYSDGLLKLSRGDIEFINEIKGVKR